VADTTGLSFQQESGAREERRRSQRFVIRRTVRYKTLRRRGSGTTIDISCGGVLFTVEEPPGLGEIVELSLDWPARLNHTTPLQLVLVGPVVRIEQNRAVVAIEQHVFRTLGLNRFFSQAAS